MRCRCWAMEGLCVWALTCDWASFTNKKTVNEEEGLYFGTLDKSGKAGWFPSFYVVPVVKK